MDEIREDNPVNPVLLETVGDLALAMCYHGKEVRLMRIEVEREDDGRWIAEVPELPGVMAYGTARREAVARTQALALRVIADRLDHGEAIPELVSS